MWARSVAPIAKNGSKGISLELVYSGQLIPTASTVVVAMSGGVDSSVAAKLLAEKVCRTLRTS
jgi:tRNA(Ile)-lysidine synthase TilS/MesJ